MTLRERAERVFGCRCAGHLGGEHLQGFEEEGSPPVCLIDAAPAGADCLYLCARAVPTWDAARRLAGSQPGPVKVDGETVGWFAPAGTPPPAREFLENPDSGPAAVADLPGRVLHHVWDLVYGSPYQTAEDIRTFFGAPDVPRLPEGAYRVGGHALVIDPTASVEPGVVFDTSEGPIWLDADVSVRAFTRLAGPSYVGQGSLLLGGEIRAVSIGPVCKIRGELANSVCLGYVNKSHDGHIGHAYLGRWVNLGAGTTNSNLKNNYGTIRIRTGGAEEDTALTKLGCLLGDHVKTGIGLQLNTGTVVGAGSSLYGAAMPPKYVPPFSWGTGDDLTAYRVEKFLEVAERIMARRGVALCEGMRRQFQEAWRTGRATTNTPSAPRTRSDSVG